MSIAIRDASLTTARRRQLALYAWRQDDQYPQNPQSKNAEQAPSHGNRGTGPTSTVPVDAAIGAALVGQTNGGQCGCSGSVLLQGYVKSSPGC